MKKLLIALFAIVLLFPAFSYTADELRSAMLAHNPDIRKAREAVTQAALDVKDAKAGYTPTLDLTITGSYIANPIDPIRVNLGDYVNTSAYGIPNDYITVYEGQENMYYQFSLSLTQPIFTWGKISNAVKLYEKVYDARLLQLEDALAKSETELWTRIAALDYLLGIRNLLDSQKKISGRLVQMADDAKTNGMMLETEALSVKVQARQVDVAKAQVDQQIALMLTELENLTGIADLQASDIEFDESSLDAVVSELCALEYQALLSKCLAGSRTTFRLLSRLSEIASLTHDIAGASVNWKPDFALVVNADYSGSRLPFVEKDWYGKDDWSATITIALKTTLYDCGKAVRNVQRTESAMQDASIDLDDARAKIRSAVDENWTGLFVSLAKIEYQQALCDQKDAENQVAANLLDTGYGSETDYLQGQLERNNCEIEMLRDRIDLATSAYTLLYLQGESSKPAD